MCNVQPSSSIVHRLSFIFLIVLIFLCSCGTASLSTHKEVSVEQNNISAIADKVWAFSQNHPQGFTLNIRTMTEPKEGIAVGYAATQNCHSRDQLHKVINHALQHDGYVGGWYNSEDSLYYFDSSKLFPEANLNDAIQFGKENNQHAVFILSSSTEIPIKSERR